MNTYLLYGAVFATVLSLFHGAWLLLSDFRSTAAAADNRRARLLAKGESSREVMLKLRRKPFEGSGGGAAYLMRRLSPYRKLDDALTRAGLTVSTGRLVLGLLAAAALATLATHAFVAISWAKAAVAGVSLGFVVPVLFIGRMGERRLKRLQTQLPEAIDIIVRSLRAGHPVATAIGTLAREMPDPIGSEFGLVFDEMTYGLDLRDALVNLGNRVPAQDLHYMIVAVRVQYGTGGNLAEILSSLSRVMRDRMRMHQKINALSAEGRLSALVLTGLPFVMAGLIALINPDYYPSVMNDPAFPTVFGTGFVGLVLGIFVMYRIVNFRV